MYLLGILWAITVFIAACGEPVGGNGKSPVFLSVRAADTYGIVCDVYVPGGTPTWDTTDVIIKSVYKDQSVNQPTTEFADVVLEEQRVTYYRNDGNPNVPDPFIMNTYTVVPNAGEATIEIPVVRGSAKLESPLKELAFGGGEGEIYLSALVEFFGEDLAGNAAYAKIVIPVWAADY